MPTVNQLMAQGLRKLAKINERNGNKEHAKQLRKDAKEIEEKAP